MFKLVAVQSVNWPVVVHVPLNGGRVRKDRFTAEFTLLPNAEQQDVLRRIADEDEPPDLLERVVTGWGEDVRGEDNQPIAYTPESKAVLLGISYVRVALLRAYVQASTGSEAARKNA